MKDYLQREWASDSGTAPSFTIHPPSPLLSSLSPFLPIPFLYVTSQLIILPKSYTFFLPSFPLRLDHPSFHPKIPLQNLQNLKFELNAKTLSVNVSRG